MLDNIVLVLAMVVNVSLVATLMRLYVKHNKMFEQKESDGMVYGTVHKLAGLFEFILNKRYLELKDPLLTVMCVVFIASFAIAFPLMCVSVVYHGIVP